MGTGGVELEKAGSGLDNSEKSISPKISGSLAADEQGHVKKQRLITPHSPWYDAFRPTSFVRPTSDELGFDTTGMTRVEIAQNQMAQGAPQLTRRHLMIVTASAGIGTGIFIGTGNTLPQGGPAALIIGFGLMSICLVLVMLSTAEMNLRYPTINPMSQLASRFLDPSWGFTIGWIYMFGYLVSSPLEIIAGAELTQFWHNDNNPAAKTNPVAWVAIIYVVDVFIHFFGGSRGYGELEFVVGTIKILGIVGWEIFTVIHVAGGISGPDHRYIGGEYFHNPGAFASGFKGVIAVIVSASFAFGGTEISGLAAAETKNPLRTIPSSTRQTFWRTMILFVTPVILIGLSVPYTDPYIGSSNSGSGSPFIRSIQLASVRALPSIFNVIIICSVVGVSNSSMYAVNRSLVALSLSGMAPSILSYVDRRGRPVVATIFTLTFSLLCFVAASDKYNDVFNWLYAFAQLAYLYVWGSICVVHIKFRYMMRRQGRSLDELVFKSPFGVLGALVGGGIVFFVFFLQIWPAAVPIKPTDNRASYFFQQDLSIPCALVLFIGHKIYLKVTTGSWGFVGWDIDLDRGTRIIDYEEMNRDETELRERMKKNFLLRLAHTLC